MSYGLAPSLQEAVYQHLAAALPGTPVHDAVPPGDVPELYVSLGPEDVRDRADKSGRGAEHRLTLSVVSRAPGFLGAKQTAAAVADALDGATLTLTRGRCIAIWFQRARARRVANGDVRRIDMTFRIRVEDD